MVPKVMIAAAAGLAVVALSTTADAQRKRDRNAGIVRACSIYGNGCTSAPIRRARFGYEFRMPRGTWVSCRADCRTALREEVLDFWETQRERQPGYIR